MLASFRTTAWSSRRRSRWNTSACSSPTVVLPTHHDGHRNRMLDMPIGPLGLMVREEFPKTKVIAPLLRTPVCINTVTKELYAWPVGPLTATRILGHSGGERAASRCGRRSLTLSPQRLTAQSTTAKLSQEPACQALTPAAAGGPAPKAQDVVVVRWLGHDQLRADVSRKRLPARRLLRPRSEEPSDRRRREGHHPGDAPSSSVTRITITSPTRHHRASRPARRSSGPRQPAMPSLAMGLPAKQVTTGQGRRNARVPRRDGSGRARPATMSSPTTVPPGISTSSRPRFRRRRCVPPLTDAERQQADRIRARGSRDPALATEGVIGYLFTFGNDFRVMFVDSSGTR